MFHIGTDLSTLGCPLRSVPLAAIPLKNRHISIDRMPTEASAVLGIAPRDSREWEGRLFLFSIRLRLRLRFAHFYSIESCKLVDDI